MERVRQNCQVGQLISSTNSGLLERRKELEDVVEVLDANTPAEGCPGQACEFIAGCRELGNVAMELAQFREKQYRRYADS